MNNDAIIDRLLSRVKNSENTYNILSDISDQKWKENIKAEIEKDNPSCVTLNMLCEQKSTNDRVSCKKIVEDEAFPKKTSQVLQKCGIDVENTGARVFKKNIEEYLQSKGKGVKQLVIECDSLPNLRELQAHDFTVKLQELRSLETGRDTSDLYNVLLSFIKRESSKRESSNDIHQVPPSLVLALYALRYRQFEVPEQFFNNNSNITSIEVPNGFMTIGKHAFENCTSLTSVTFPTTLTTIRENAFMRCSSLNSVTLPDSLTTIDSAAFFDCTSLKSVTFPDSLTTIGEGAFAKCTSLTKVDLSKTKLTTIGEKAFSSCSALQRVDMSNDETKTIGAAAFSKCRFLSDFTFSTVLTTISEFAFFECGLRKVMLPDSLETIGRAAFSKCTLLEEVDLSHTRLKAIHKQTFSSCSALRRVDMSDSEITTIEKQAFERCTSLEEVEFPDSLTTIAEYAFVGCTSLGTVDLSNTSTNSETIHRDAFSECNVNSIIYPNKTGREEKKKRKREQEYEERYGEQGFFEKMPGTNAYKEAYAEEVANSKIIDVDEVGVFENHPGGVPIGLTIKRVIL